MVIEEDKYVAVRRRPNGDPKRVRSPEFLAKRREISRVYEREKLRASPTNKRLLKNARSRALRKNLDFNLTPEDIIIPEFCPILGIKLEHGINKVLVGSPTLDRIDNNKGYTKDNVAVISHKANSHKANLTIEQVEKLLKYMKKELN